MERCSSARDLRATAYTNCSGIAPNKERSTARSKCQEPATAGSGPRASASWMFVAVAAVASSGCSFARVAGPSKTFG